MLIMEHASDLRISKWMIWRHSILGRLHVEKMSIIANYDPKCPWSMVISINGDDLRCPYIHGILCCIVINRQSRPASAAYGIEVFIQIAEGLKYIHSQVGLRWGLGLLRWLMHLSKYLSCHVLNWAYLHGRHPGKSLPRRAGHCLSRFEAGEHTCGSWANPLRCSAVVCCSATLGRPWPLRTGIIQNEVCWRSNCPTLDIPSSSMMDTARRSPENLGWHCGGSPFCFGGTGSGTPSVRRMAHFTLRWAPRSIGHLRLDDAGGN